MGRSQPITCPTCRGGKQVTAFFPVYAKSVPKADRKPVVDMDCPTCDGEGIITTEHATRMAAGRQLREKRLGKRLGLRRCAEAIGIKPSDLSYAEQGKLLMRKIVEFGRMVDGCQSDL
jgi:hypothetical protein